MILEHRRMLTHARPNITFQYITPLQPKMQNAVCPPQPLVRSQPLPFVFRKQMVSYVANKEEQKSQQKPSQRKKIFDRTYTCKSSFHRASSREASLDSKQARLQKHQPKKQRKTIFPKRNKNVAFTHYPSHNYSPPQSEVKHSSSLAGFPQQIHSQSETYHPFVHHPEPPSAQLNNPSVIRVEMSESAADESIDNSEVFHLPNNTDQRFYDRDSLTPQRNNEKLSEVNLYATTANASFLTKPESTTSSTFHDLLKSIRSQLQASVLPFLLVLFGFFILLVQAAE